MKIVKLGSIVKIVKGKKATSVFDIQEDGSVRFIQIDDLRNDNNLKFTDEKGVFAKPDDVIIAWDGANAGTIGYGLEGIIGSTLAKLEIQNSEVYPRFLGRFLQSKSRYFRDGCTGATIPHISKQVLTNIHVSLPSIEDQKRTVKILDQVDALRKKRKQAVELLDDYLESVFLEMFGDPVRNPKGFEVARISDITSHIKDGPHVSPEYADTGVLILSTRNVRPGELVLEDAKYVSQHTFEELTKIFRPQKGDVLVTKGGTTGYAKVVDFDWPFCVWVHIAVLRPTPEIDSIYLEGAMNSDYCYRQSQLYTHGIANRDLGLTRIAKIKLLKPPLEEQQKYASRICSIRMIKQKMISQAEELEIQFQALMQKAFKGQL